MGVEEEKLIEEELIPVPAPVENVDAKKATSNKAIQRSRKVTGSKKRRQSGSLLPLKKRRTHFNQTVSLNSHKVPYMGYTMEEMLRVNSLSERLETIKGNFSLIYGVGGNGKRKLEMGIDVGRIRELASSLIFDGFDEFSGIERTYGFRIIYDSWPALVAAGESSQELLWLGSFKASHIGDKKIHGNGSHERNEDWINEVTESIRQLLSGDKRLIVLFLLSLVTTTYQESPPCSWNQLFRGLAAEISLLLFRYLKLQMQSSKAAASKAHSLAGYIKTMHRCGENYMHKGMS